MKNLNINLASLLCYSILWMAWGAILYYATPVVLKMNWFYIICAGFIGLWLSHWFDKISIVFNLWTLTKNFPSLSSLYWAWIPTLTLGLCITLFPWKICFGMAIDCGSISFKVWIVTILMSLFPALNIYGILRTPSKVAQAIREPDDPWGLR